MVDISSKPVSYREAKASGRINLKPKTIERIRNDLIEKGNPLQISILAGINSSKLTHILLPLCHPLKIENTNIEAKIQKSYVEIISTVKGIDKSGVEMEALTSTAIALLNIWDITKQYEKTNDGQYPTTSISHIKVIKKIKRKIDSS
uniref:Molybdenum cofactor biosynthesis subunit (MoaC) n=1 Tax=uncultured marine thaumarchaeote KM3_06_C02 TaxID=1455976 RepID=A0A075G9Q4_9ARCH|nr:molybdenum cofactor biosynthesis subunit (moaC) [uncultured marine thaumarchaeote KM3_06_C02]